LENASDRQIAIVQSHSMSSRLLDDERSDV